MIAVGTASNFSGDRGRALVSRMIYLRDFGQELGSNLIFLHPNALQEMASTGIELRGYSGPSIFLQANYRLTTVTKKFSFSHFIFHLVSYKGFERRAIHLPILMSLFLLVLSYERGDCKYFFIVKFFLNARLIRLCFLTTFHLFALLMAANHDSILD